MKHSPSVEFVVESRSEKGPHKIAEAEDTFRYSALRKTNATSGQWIMIGIVISAFMSLNY